MPDLLRAPPQLGLALGGLGHHFWPIVGPSFLSQGSEVPEKAGTEALWASRLVPSIGSGWVVPLNAGTPVLGVERGRQRVPLEGCPEGGCGQGWARDSTEKVEAVYQIPVSRWSSSSSVGTAKPSGRSYRSPNPLLMLLPSFLRVSTGPLVSPHGEKYKHLELSTWRIARCLHSPSHT